MPGKVVVGQVFTVDRIKGLCARGYMGMELSFVPLGNRTPIGGIGILQMWSSDFGSENVARFSFQGKDGDSPIWRLEEWFHPFILRLLLE